jgi:hypothetical protein
MLKIESNWCHRRIMSRNEPIQTVDSVTDMIGRRIRMRRSQIPKLHKFQLHQLLHLRNRKKNLQKKLQKNFTELRMRRDSGRLRKLRMLKKLKLNLQDRRRHKKMNRELREKQDNKQ